MSKNNIMYVHPLSGIHLIQVLHNERKFWYTRYLCCGNKMDKYDFEVYLFGDK